MDTILEIILHTDDALLALVAKNTLYVYLILFLIIILETGLIIFPFLPGDGLLFSAGVVAASTNLNVWILVFLLIIAAILGNILNYFVGNLLGKKVLESSNYFVKKYFIKNIPKTQNFYDKYGGKAIIIGRFFPIIRTYIPFFAGIIGMEKKPFVKYSIIGAVSWVCFFVFIGFLVGEITWVKNNYGLIFLSLIVVTFLPLFYSIIRTRLHK